MALLSVVGNESSKVIGRSATSTISGEGILIICLIIIFILLVVGGTWVITKLIDLMEEKRKYFRNLNKKFRKENDTT